MTQTSSPTPPGFEELSIEEKIRYIQDLWDSVAEEAESMPVPDWHKRVLDKRLKSHRENPKAGRPWSEIRDEILSEL